MHSFSKVLLSVKFVKDRTFVFVILCGKMQNSETLKSNPNPTLISRDQFVCLGLRFLYNVFAVAMLIDK